MNLFDVFQRAFALEPGKTALYLPVENRKLSFADLDRLSAQVAHVLVDAGVAPGDRVAGQVEKSAEALALYLGVLRAGGSYIPLNTAYMPDEVDYFVGNAEPTVVVTLTSQVGLYDEIRSRREASYKIFSLEQDGSGTLKEALQVCEERFDTVERDDKDVAAILYTSGTTGRPKGAMLTHLNLRSNLEVLIDYWGWGRNDTLLHALPIFHFHGLFVGCNICLATGAEMIYLPKFDADQVIAHMPQATTMMGVPTFYTRLLREDRFDRSVAGHMRLFISGSAPLLEETFEQFEARTGHTILERYGMTETGMNTSNPLNGARRPGTVGFPLPGVEARVVDENNASLPAGSVGSLQVRGDNVFSGYWRMPEKTASEFTEDGFFITGDLARIDDRGYVSIVGREKDLIITGGYNVYPKEVEMVINELPGVAESAVFAVPHADFGEGVAVAIVKEAGQQVADEEVQAACEARLAKYKLPRTIIYLDELPRNAMGKVQKNVLRKEYGG